MMIMNVSIAEIASNGGRNNVVVVQMWANLSPQQYSGGEWAFMSPCVDPASGAHTTNVVGAGISPCGQQVTTNSPIGSAITVCPSYQLQYSSLPFGAAGKFGGLTFKRQFGGLLQLVGTPSSPDYVFMSSWNELIAQPQPNPFNSPDAFSMGLPTDPQGPELW